MEARGKAVQVEHIRLTLGLKALGFQPVESTYLSKFWFQIVNLHPYTKKGEELTKVTTFEKNLARFTPGSSSPLPGEAVQVEIRLTLG